MLFRLKFDFVQTLGHTAPEQLISDEQCSSNQQIFLLQVDEVFLHGMLTDEHGRFKCEDVVKLLKYGEGTEANVNCS